MKIHIDFETRSAIDLRQVGAYRYAEDPSTDVWCMAYAIDDAPVQLWTPGEAFPFWNEYLDPCTTFHAWNAGFERAMWAGVMAPRYNWPRLDLRLWQDTMARAAQLALPMSLEKAAVVLGVGEKNMAGRRLALQMARPRRIEEDGTIVWWTTPEKLTKLYNYCRTDVEVERAISRVIGELEGFELEVWRTDQRMNDRGVRIDRELAASAQVLVDLETEKVNARLQELTGGEVEAVTNHDAIRIWVNSRGVITGTVARAWLEETLEHGAAPGRDGQDRFLPPDVREVLQHRLDAGRSSTAKLARMLGVPCADGRAHGLLSYHVAGTGRWGGRLIQPQNLPRGSWDASDGALVMSVLSEDPELLWALWGPPLEVVASSLRGMIVAEEGHDLLAVDYSAIEARVLPWLAGQQDLLDQFSMFDRTGDKRYEPYVVMAEKIGMNRQGGKVTILGAGFGMGWKTFIAHAASYGVELTEAEARRILYDVYRVENRHIVQLWYDLQDAALRAVREPGLRVDVGPHLYMQKRGWFLWMGLPSGRELAYASPSIVMRPVPWDKTDLRPSVRVWNVNSVTRQWSPRHLYGGLLAENATQAVARDIMADALVKLDGPGPYQPLLTIHDEILCEVPEGEGSLQGMIEVMNDTPAWADGCPIAATGWRGKRYRKD